MKRLILLLLVLIFSVPFSYADEPQREKGISVHALPKRVADLSGKPWGLWVAYNSHLQPEPGQPILQSIADVLAYVQKQDATVIENGLWVVTTHPSSYSKNEIEFQEKLKSELPKHNIPLFWARGAELDKGFKRY